MVLYYQKVRNMNKQQETANETNKKVFEIYQDGMKCGMAVGIALGRFYEKHNIADSIPPELEKEANAVIEKALIAGRKDQ